MALKCGLSLLVVAVVATGEFQPAVEAECDSSDQGCMPAQDVQSLSLLQMELRLQRDKISHHTDAKPPLVTAAVADRDAGMGMESQQHGKVKAPRVLLSIASKLMDSEAASKDPTLRESKIAFQQIYTTLRRLAPIERSVALIQSPLQSRTQGVALNDSPSGTVWLVICIAALAIGLLLCVDLTSSITAEYQRGSKDKEDVRPAAGRPTSEGPAAQQLLPTPKTAGAQANGAQAEASAPEGPPPICPSLILPHTEARFMVPMKSLMRGSGEIPIQGTTGRKLLSGSVAETPEGLRCFNLASSGCEDDPRVSVVASASEGASAEGCIPKMEIYGQGRQFYGTLEPALDGGRGIILRCRDQIVMTLEAGPEDLCMTASSMDGRLLATAGKNVQIATRRLESQDTWKLQVKPSLDAVLIASCMLSALLFAK